MRKITAVSLILCFALLFGAIPATRASALPALSAKDRHQMDSEIKQGAAAAAEIAKSAKFVTDKAKVDRVNRIGQRLAAMANSVVVPAGFGNDHVYPFTWRFFIIQDKDINAFSIPGGYVYIYSGLLDKLRSDDELAGVLGHEITHSAHHHIQSLAHEQGKMNTEMMAGLIAAIFAHVPTRDIANLAEGAQYAQLGIMNEKYNMPAERDADNGGTILMQKAGYNPVAMLTFMEYLEDIEKRSPEIEMGIFRDHPYTSERIELIKTHLAAMSVPITTEAMRAVTHASRATVQTTPGQSSRILFASLTLVTLADPNGTRAQAAADQLNAALDRGLAMYQVKADDGVLLVDNAPLIRFSPEDVALSPGQTAQTLATSARQALLRGLWAQSVSDNAPVN